MTTDQHALYGRQLGDFTIRDLIDAGGFGSIYRCEQPLLGREAVIKVMHERLRGDEDACRRFSAEARLAARIDHPYAASVYAHGIEDDGLVWIAMELVHGVSLQEYLEDHGPMPLEICVPFLERIAAVVHAAHSEGIVHRDLKPANIMVIDRDGVLEPKLLDFGVAKMLSDSARAAPPDTESTQRLKPNETLRGCIVGTAAYASPEIWNGDESGPAADIYALGVIAFEALTGRRPYRAETFLAFGTLHLTGEIPRVDPVLPRALDAVFRRALAKQPEDRYDSAMDLAAALRGVLDEMAAALRYALEEGRRRSAARRSGAWFGALMAAVVFAGGVGRARYEQRIAEQRAADASELARLTAIAAEVEQGRAALLGGDMAGAQQHLGAAVRGGDHSRATAFMLARATRPLRSEMARLPAGKGRMWSSSWSPDGKRIATTDDAGAQIWDAATYQSLSELPHEDVVYAAAWAPGDRLVTACGDGSVRIWDAARGDLVRELRLRGKAPRWYVVAAAGGRVAAVDAKGAIAAVWDTATGKVSTELPLTGAGWPAVAFSADGRWLAATGGDAVKVVDATGRTVGTAGEQVRSIAWDPAGARLLIGAATGDALIWGAPGVRPAARLGEAVTAVAWSPDGARLALGGEDGAEQIVDTVSGRILSQGNYLHARVASLAFSTDGQRLVAAGVSGELAIGGGATGPPVEVLEGPTQQLRGAMFDGAARRVLAASWDGTARIWDARSPYRQWSAPRLSSGFGLFGGVEPDGRYLAIACPGCATRVWDTAQDRLLAELPEVGGRGDEPVTFPAVSAGGDRAAIVRGSIAEIYALPGGTLIRTVAHTATVTALAFGPDGELVSGSANGAVLETRGKATDVLAAPGGAGIAALAVLPDGRIAFAETGGRVRILDGASARISSGARVRMLRPSPDGRRLLVVPFHASAPAPMTLLAVDRGETLVELDGPPVYAARWVDGGILSAHADGAARLWSADGALLHTYTGGARFLADADLTPDGSMVVGGGGDGMLRFWDTATAKTLWVVSAHRPYIMGVHFEGGDIVTRGIGGEVARWHILAAKEAKYAQTLPNQ